MFSERVIVGRYVREASQGNITLAERSVNMDVEVSCGVLRAFAQLKNPRMDRTKKHRLSDILTIAICDVFCGADGWVQVGEFGDWKKEWFRTFLDLPNGIFSYDTFGQVFALLEPEAFEGCFLAWVNRLAVATEGRLVAFDGNTIRRSLDAANGQAAIHMVSTWCQANHMVLGQLATEPTTSPGSVGSP